MHSDEFRARLLLSSTLLVREANLGLPTNAASGCLIDYRGRRILLTAAHVTGDDRHWSIQLAYIEKRGTVLHALGAMNYLAKGRIGDGTLEDVDLSYAEVPGDILPFRQDIDISTGKILHEAPITIYAPTLEEIPRRTEEYGFYGLTFATREDHFGKSYLSGELAVQSGLSFLRTEEDFHIFTLPSKHPGHHYFRGCSGAPVVDTNGCVIGLVCSGNEERNEIWAVSLAKYKVGIDATLASGSA